MLTLYDYFRSSACFRVRIALNLKGLSYEKTTIHLLNNGGEQFTPDYTSKNPLQLIPTLETSDAILTQSLAIIEYLNEIYPTPPLLPEHPIDKAHVRAFALSIAADIHPLNNLRVLQYLKETIQLSEDDKLKWYHHWIEKGFKALEASLNIHNQGHDFCFGPQPSLADICLIPQWYNAIRFNCNVSAYPTLKRIYETCEQLPEFISAFPETTVTSS